MTAELQPTDALHRAPWRRVVALGDSIVEGIREPSPGYPDRSWLELVTQRLADVSPDLEATNFGRRDLTAAEVREQQLGPALACRPDLAFVVAGGNDMLRRGFDAAAVGSELSAIIGALRAAGATVVTMDLLDPTGAGHVPEQYRRPMADKLAQLAGVTRAVADAHGAVHVGLRAQTDAFEPAWFARDGLHLTTAGHAWVAGVVVRRLDELGGGGGR